MKRKPCQIRPADHEYSRLWTRFWALIAAGWVLFSLNCVSPPRHRFNPMCQSDADVIANPNCYKICTDLHYYSNGQCDETVSIEIPDHPEFKKRTFYIGDIFDLENGIQNASGSRKESCRRKIVTEIDRLSRVLGDRYILGNHEMNGCKDCPVYTITNGILFTHGHYLCWDESKIRYWASGKDPAQKPDGRGHDLDCWQTARQWALEHEVHTVVFGHEHPLWIKVRHVAAEKPSRAAGSPRSITLINLRKGCVYLELPLPAAQ